MENTASKMRKIMRDLHNKIGYFIVGLVIIYSLSGVVQTYRDTSFLKHEVAHEKTIEKGLVADSAAQVAKIGKAVNQKELKITKTEGTVLYFKDGSYDASTGIAKFTTKELYEWVKPFTELHKSNSKGVIHYFTILFAIALFFMSVSAFWMFKPGTKAFSSGVILTVLGIIASIILVLAS
jgi:hypothetical protein